MGGAVAHKTNIWEGFRLPSNEPLRSSALHNSTPCWLGRTRTRLSPAFRSEIRDYLASTPQPASLRFSPHIPRPYYYNYLYRSIELSRYSLALSLNSVGL